MTDKGKAIYQKRRATLVATRFGGDEAAYEHWLIEHMRSLGAVGGKNSSNRPFRDSEAARRAGRQPRTPKPPRDENEERDIYNDMVETTNDEG